MKRELTLPATQADMTPEHIVSSAFETADRDTNVMSNAVKERGVGRREILLISVVLVIALVYLTFALSDFLKGYHGDLRGAVVLALSAVFVLSLRFRRKRIAV